MTAPNCFACRHRRALEFDTNSKCINTAAQVKGEAFAVKRGWFCWPDSFDPAHLESCDGFDSIWGGTGRERIV